jgi:hypothetical protein
VPRPAAELEQRGARGNYTAKIPYCRIDTQHLGFDSFIDAVTGSLLVVHYTFEYNRSTLVLECLFCKPFYFIKIYGAPLEVNIGAHDLCKDEPKGHSSQKLALRRVGYWYNNVAIHYNSTLPRYKAYKKNMGT